MGLTLGRAQSVGGSDLQDIADRHYRERPQHREEREKRRQPMEEAIRPLGREILFREQLDRVGQQGVDQS